MLKTRLELDGAHGRRAADAVPAAGPRTRLTPDFNLRGFRIAAEEALEEWIFDQNLFRGSADSVEEAAEVSAKPRPGRKQKKEQDTVAADRSGDES